jgi:WD40 repeat protein
MALTTERITLPRGPGTLRQLVQSNTHVMSVNGSGPSHLVDLSGKKPVVHELPTLIVRGEGSNPDQAMCLASAAFSPDGTLLALLREGTPKISPSLELMSVSSLEVTKRIELKLDAPSSVQWHPDGSRLYVGGNPQTGVYSPTGKVLDRIGTAGGFVLSPDGEHFAIKLAEGKWVTRPSAATKVKFVEFETRDVSFIDAKTVLLSRWEKDNQELLLTASVASPRVKKLFVMPGTSSHAALGDRAVAIDAKGDKVIAFVIDLKTKKAQQKELQGSPSGTAVSLGPTRAFVQVNWSKTIHVLRF